jgi:hypothetical protein
MSFRTTNGSEKSLSRNHNEHGQGEIEDKISRWRLKLPATALVQVPPQGFLVVPPRNDI